MITTTNTSDDSGTNWKNRINHERDRELVDYISSLANQPTQRVVDILRNSSTVSSGTLIKLMKLALWPIIHERIYNPTVTDVIIDSCIVDDHWCGEIKLSQSSTKSTRTIKFNTEWIWYDTITNDQKK